MFRRKEKFPKLLGLAYLFCHPLSRLQKPDGISVLESNVGRISAGDVIKVTFFNCPTCPLIAMAATLHLIVTGENLFTDEGVFLDFSPGD